MLDNKQNIKKTAEQGGQVDVNVSLFNALFEIKTALNNIEEQRPQDEVVFIKFFADGSGSIVSSELNEDFEPIELYNFANLKECISIIDAYQRKQG